MTIPRSYNQFLKASKTFFLTLVVVIITGLPATSQEIHKFPRNQSKPSPMPCSFNGAKVAASASLHTGVQSTRCCPKCKGYEAKRGTSINVKRGTPIVAIADMKLIEVIDHSAKQKSIAKFPNGNSHGKTYYQTEEIMKPFDDVQMFFIDRNGNIIFYYHLLDTNLVKGFKKGKCEPPLEYAWGKKPMLPKNCGGFSETLVKNNFWVKKGDIIGVSGTTGARGAHFSLGVAVPRNENFRKFLLKITKSHSPPKKSPHSIFAYPYTQTAKQMRYTAPQRDFLWEKMPTENDNVYLIPVMSKSFLRQQSHD